MDSSAAEKTMVANLQKNTGKSLEEWVVLVKQTALEKHGQIIKFLKEEHEMTHGFANLIAHKSNQSDAGSVADKDALALEPYKGKEHFLPIYEGLMKRIQSFGSDVELAPKKTYMSLRRKKQFAILNPATKTRYEIGINLKGHPGEGILESVNKANAMCSHQINLQTIEDLNETVFEWLKKAYDHAG